MKRTPNERDEPSVIGPKIPGIRYKTYVTERGRFLMPFLPQTPVEEEITVRFLKRSSYTLRNWEAMVLAYWICCITTQSYELGEVIFFEGVNPNESAQVSGSISAGCRAGRCADVVQQGTAASSSGR